MAYYENRSLMYQPSGEDGIVLKKRQRSPLKPGNHFDNSDRKNDPAAKRTRFFSSN